MGRVATLCPGAQLRNYWWPRRKVHHNKDETGRRLYNREAVEGSQLAAQNEMSLLETFNLKVGNHQRRGLENYDKKKPELSLDIHMKRRKYVEDLVAKSLESEALGETNSAEKQRLRESESLGSRSFAPLSTRSPRAKFPELHKSEQRLVIGGNESSPVLTRTTETTKMQVVYGGSTDSWVEKVREEMIKTQELNPLGKTEGHLKEVADHGKAAGSGQEVASISKLGSGTQTLSNASLKGLGLISNDNIKFDSTIPIDQSELRFANSIADSLRLNKAKHGSATSSLTKEQPFQKYKSEDSSAVTFASKDLTGAVEATSEPKSDQAEEASSLVKTLGLETKALDVSWRPTLVSRMEYCSKLESDLQSKLPLDFGEQATAQDPSTSIESEINRQQSTTIHILGMGPVGKYIAHSLSRLEHGPRVTLLMHRPLMIQEWHDEGAAIRVLKDGKILVASEFHVESSAEFGRRKDSRERFPGFGERLEHTVEQPSTPIDHLVVTTDPNTTVKALSSIMHRIRNTSTIVLVQDGLGMVEILNSTLFTDSQRRPTYVLASMSHDLVSTEQRFTIIEKRSGEISCTKLPRTTIHNRADPDAPPFRRVDFSWSPESKNILGIFYRVSGLNTSTLGHKSFYKAQLERLAVGAVIGPLSVAFDCRNDQLLYNYPASILMKKLLEEISNIITSLPEIRNMSIGRKYFSPQYLEHRVLSSISKTGMNISPMLRAVRAGERTNIEFMNGYLVQRAEELGIRHPVNQLLMTIVRGKCIIKKREADGYIPFSKS